MPGHMEKVYRRGESKDIRAPKGRPSLQKSVSRGRVLVFISRPRLGVLVTASGPKENGHLRGVGVQATLVEASVGEKSVTKQDVYMPKEDVAVRKSRIYADGQEKEDSLPSALYEDDVDD